MRITFSWEWFHTKTRIDTETCKWPIAVILFNLRAREETVFLCLSKISTFMRP